MTATQALTDTGARSWLPAELRDWLDAHAQALDEGAEDPASVLPRLAEAGVFRLGVPASQGGLEGSDAGDAIEAVSQLAEHSVAAAFVAWGQRVFIEYLLHSPNQALARDWTGPLLRGELAGATALSNAMKFLSGIESLQISARQDGDDWAGRPHALGHQSAPGWLPGGGGRDRAGRHAGRGGAAAGHRRPDAQRRPAPAGPAIEQHGGAGSEGRAHQPALADPRRCPPVPAAGAAGLRRAAMRPVHRPGPARAAPGRDGGQGQGARGILAEPLAQLQAQVEYLSDQLIAGVREGRYVAEPWLLFEVRIALAEAAQQAVQLELQASGGAAYLKPAGDGFARRWREAAFLPIVTPSLVQLKTELAKRRARLPPRRRHERRHERRRAGAARARPDAALSGRRRRRVPGREPGPGAWRGAGRAGRQRGRQVQPAARAGRAAGAQRRRARHGRPAAGRRASARGRGVSGSGPLALADAGTQRGLRPGLQASAGAGCARARAWTWPSRKSACRTPASCGRPSCPAAWRSAPRWRAAWPASRRCCCWTSRSGRWTRSRAPRCRRCCARWWPTSAPPRC